MANEVINSIDKSIRGHNEEKLMVAWREYDWNAGTHEISNFQPSFSEFTAPLQYMPICYPISERNSPNIQSISAWLSHRWHRHGHGYMRKRERGREGEVFMKRRSALSLSFPLED